MQHRCNHSKTRMYQNVLILPSLHRALNNSSRLLATHAADRLRQWTSGDALINLRDCKLTKVAVIRVGVLTIEFVLIAAVLIE